jgi:hypothetical protein
MEVSKSITSYGTKKYLMVNRLSSFSAAARAIGRSEEQQTLG